MPHPKRAFPFEAWEECIPTEEPPLVEMTMEELLAIRKKLRKKLKKVDAMITLKNIAMGRK